jgi:putative acyl-CoA dehydrogenase
VELAAGGDRRLDEHVAKLRENLGDRGDLETRARRIIEDLALALQGSLMVRHAGEVADALCASRLGEAGGLAYGTLPPNTDLAAIIDRHRPRPD